MNFQSLPINALNQIMKSLPALNVMDLAKMSRGLRTSLGGRNIRVDAQIDVVRAYQSVIKFVDELERLRKQWNNKLRSKAVSIPIHMMVYSEDQARRAYEIIKSKKMNQIDARYIAALRSLLKRHKYIVNHEETRFGDVTLHADRQHLKVVNLEINTRAEVGCNLNAGYIVSPAGRVYPGHRLWPVCVDLIVIHGSAIGKLTYDGSRNREERLRHVVSVSRFVRPRSQNARVTTEAVQEYKRDAVRVGIALDRAFISQKKNTIYPLPIVRVNAFERHGLNGTQRWMEENEMIGDILDSRHGRITEDNRLNIAVHMVSRPPPSYVNATGKLINGYLLRSKRPRLR